MKALGGIHKLGCAGLRPSQTSNWRSAQGFRQLPSRVIPMAMIKCVVFLPEMVLDEYAAMSKRSGRSRFCSYAGGARRRS